MASVEMSVNMITAKRKRYSLCDKDGLGQLCHKYKTEYADIMKRMPKRWDSKRKIWTEQKPKEGFLAKAVREAFPELAGKANSDPAFQKAKQVAMRALSDYEKKINDPTFVPLKPSKKQFRQPGAGRKPTAPEVRQAIFEWFVDIRGSLKARLSKGIFRLKCEQLYDEYLRQQNLEVADEDRLKFSNQWIRGWQEEYRVSLTHPNKRFAVAENVRKERLLQFIKNIIRVRIFFEKKLNVNNVDIINGDQMPLHRNESSGQKTLSLRDCPTYVKENYMLSRERVTVYTQASSKQGMQLRPQFVFKGKGTILQGKLNRPDGVTTHWAPKGSYRLETMKATIDTLPNLKTRNIFSQRQWAIYILDDYSVHVTDEVKHDLLACGYILVVMGGGITGDIQINDTHIHHLLKVAYRKQEAELMAEQLRSEPNKVPSPTRDDMMRMLVSSWDSLTVDVNSALKQNFITNALDGSEDIYVRDKLFKLVGEEVVAFREEEMAKEPPKSMTDLMATITPPEGVRRGAATREVPDEGYELMDAEDGEIEFDNDNDDDDDDDDDDNLVNGASDLMDESTPETLSESSNMTNIITAPSSTEMLSAGQVGLPTNTADIDLNQDAEFLNELGILLNTRGQKTSSQMMPHLCHMRSAYEKARNSIKKRLQSSGSLVRSLVLSLTSASSSPNMPTNAADDDGPVASTSADMSVYTPDIITSTDSPDTTSNSNVESPSNTLSLNVSDHVLIKYGEQQMPAVIVRGESGGLAVRYFDKTTGSLYTAQESEYDVLREDIISNINPPKMEFRGSRIYYQFTDAE